MFTRDRSFVIIAFFERRKIRFTCEQMGIGIVDDTWEHDGESLEL